MGYKVVKRDGIKTLFNGRSWSYGASIAPSSVPPHLWEAYLAEGAVVDESQVQSHPTPVETKPESNLVDIVGLGMIAALSEVGVNTVEDLQIANDDDLLELEGVGPATIRKWKEAIK